MSFLGKLRRIFLIDSTKRGQREAVFDQERTRLEDAAAMWANVAISRLEAIIALRETMRETRAVLEDCRRELHDIMGPRHFRPNTQPRAYRVCCLLGDAAERLDTTARETYREDEERYPETSAHQS